MRRVKLQRLAREDFKDAHLWYKIRDPELATDLVYRVSAALKKAASQPELYAVVEKRFGIRKILLDRFPYKAFFSVEPNRIVVHAILHASRSDQNLRDRLR